MITPHLRVVRRIGIGGQGEVYEIEGPDGARYAAKVLLPELKRDATLVARLEREAKTAVTVEHPNVVRVFGLETSHDDRIMVVMELLKGRTLSAVLKAGPLPVAKAAETALEIAHGLEAVHAAKLIHRDLKPANVFLADTPHGWTAKLMDFGIAKSSSGYPQTQLTQTGAILGTPAYMSPEQIERPEDIDERSDHYSFGVVLFEMLCGRPPFQSDQAGQLLMMHARQQPPSPRAIRPEVPQPMAAFVLRALEKSPDRRFANTQELIRRLDAARSIESRRPKVLEDTQAPATGRAASEAPTELDRGHVKSTPLPVPPVDSRPPWTTVALKVSSALVVGAAVAVLGLSGIKRMREGSPEDFLLVTSEPPGAEVYVDGELAVRKSGDPQLTPARVRADRGKDHEIRIVSPDFGEETHKIMADEEREPLHASFAASSARIELIAPNGAKISVGGQLTKERKITVKPGTVVIEAKYSPQCSDKVEVVAMAGTTQTVELKPTCSYEGIDYGYWE